jgi:hypothetical protein
MLDRAAVVLALLTPVTPAPLPAAQVAWAVLPGRGTAAEVRLAAICSPAAGTFYTLRMTLAQRTGRTVATGSTEISGACTGLWQSLTLRAGAYAAFRRGRASVGSCLRVHPTPPRPAVGTDGPCAAGHTTLVILTAPA